MIVHGGALERARALDLGADDVISFPFDATEFPFAFTKYQAKKTTFDPKELKQRFAVRDEIQKTLGPTRYQAFGNGSVRVR